MKSVHIRIIPKIIYFCESSCLQSNSVNLSLNDYLFKKGFSLYKAY